MSDEIVTPPSEAQPQETPDGGRRSVTTRDGRVFEARQVALRDGRKVLLRELDGADEIIAVRLTEAKSQAEALTVQSVLLALSIHEIDGQPVNRPSCFADVCFTMRGFRLRDVERLRAAYKALNEGAEGEAGAGARP